jgi:hypothetical protein
MMFSKPLIVAIVFFATVVFAGVPSHAQEYGRHPAYLHALSDLRLMRAYLDRLTPSERIDDESQHAIGEIDAAIREIKEASIDDGKDLRDHLPVDARITPTNRYHKAREAGTAAWADINREEDNGYARGLKHRALGHIEEANHTVDKIIRRVDRM